MNEFSQFRQEYSGQPIDIQQMTADPFTQFRVWLDEAFAVNIKEPNAMTLATADEHGRPSCRVVLLKEFNNNGFTFFTNYSSRKGREISINPHVSLLFFWFQQQRQIRIDGTAEKTREDESDRYFQSRPIRSQIAAIVSSQSSVIASREILDSAFEAQLDRCNSSEIKRPQHWGGYRVIPETFEFWQGQADRLHDRIRYRLDNEVWVKERLSP
jgi:pyridoxamine 5'-phosphate oxidase